MSRSEFTPWQQRSIKLACVAIIILGGVFGYCTSSHAGTPYVLLANVKPCDLPAALHQLDLDGSVVVAVYVDSTIDGTESLCPGCGPVSRKVACFPVPGEHVNTVTVVYRP